MEQHLGRSWKIETVDHIDRDFTNDAIENLQIKERGEHAALDVVRVELVEITCMLCGTKAMKSARNLRGNAKKGMAGPFCGRDCAGKYRGMVASGEIEPLPTQPSPESIYYQLPKE